MGGDDLKPGSSLLEFIQDCQVTVKNTFIHLDHDGSEDCDVCPLMQRRLKTDPGYLQFASRPQMTHSPNADYFQTESDTLSPVEEDAPKEPTSPCSFESGYRVVWDVDAKKLDSKDCRITHTCKIPEGPCTDFIVWLQPDMQKKRRGCSNFSASKGKGFIHVKCNDVKDIELALSVEVGGDGLPAPGMPPLRIRHNFAQNSVVVLPHLWDFKGAMDMTTNKLTLGLEVMPCTTLQSSIRTSPAETESAPWPTTPDGSDSEDYPRFPGVGRRDRNQVLAWANGATWWVPTIPVELSEGLDVTTPNWWTDAPLHSRDETTHLHWLVPGSDEMDSGN